MSIFKIVGIAVGAVAIGLAGLSITNPGNVAETSADAPDANFRTRHYQVDFDTFVSETKKIVPTLTTYGQSWKLTGSGSDNDREKQSNSMTIGIEVPVVFFVDDVEISAVKESNKDEVQVNVRSNSRVGKSDLGENKRHVRQLLDALDEKFGHQ